MRRGQYLRRLVCIRQLNDHSRSVEHCFGTGVFLLKEPVDAGHVAEGKDREGEKGKGKSGNAPLTML